MSEPMLSGGKTAAQAVAYAAARKVEFKPTDLVEYNSNGHVLVIANTPTLSSFGSLPPPLSSEPMLLDRLDPGETLSIEGALGAFVVSAGKHRWNASLVVDLSPRPSLSMALKPPGYFWAGDSEDYAAVKAEVGELVGIFEKPKYFNYELSACAHGRSGNTGCTRCIDACPAQAIVSNGDGIEVNPYRCQGGGICASVCPTGAISYAFPVAEDLLNHVRALIQAYTEASGETPGIVFVNEAQEEQAERSLPGSLRVCVEEVASVGPEVLLSALAWGARNVQIFDLDSMPESARQALDIQVDMVVKILVAMGYPARALTIISELPQLLTVEVMPQIVAAQNMGFGEKRQALYLALDHLVEQAEKYRSPVSLPSGSIFGEAVVNTDSCTLCMACVSACPGNALQDGGEKPQLGFVEASCVQCGICTSTCPEDAITISPRMLLDREARSTRRVLHEDAPFHCVSCGKPFATTSGITTILARLQGHSMFENERSRYRLKMCGECRVKDMMEDPDVDL